MDKFPDIVTFIITSKCNNDCRYCYGPSSHTKDMSFIRFKKVIRLFHKKGVKAVVVTGGEPTTHKHFEEILRAIKKSGMKIFLDTDGDFFFKHARLITETVDMLGVPIDFPDTSYRNKNNLNNVLKLLEYYKNKKKRPSIRIGTVVTRDNYKQLENIGELLRKYDIDMWKLYEFIPMGTNALRYKRELKITEKEYFKSTTVIKKFSKYYKIVLSSSRKRVNAYFIIASDGTVFLPLGGPRTYKEVIIGDVFDDGIIEKWEQVVSKTNYKNNAKTTFHHKF